ncbi:UNVERIFIED_CONTAM: hypothetical protein Sradi_3183100 [Sesamum radiatum]|uniref:Uncharacterized protein n=1 Tax=Sesamum radiatum TaxID=300843 RepID=A0AAW2RH17_SESRA
MLLGTGTAGARFASSGAPTLEGVAAPIGVRVANCSWITMVIICWMVPRRTGDNSAEGIFKEVPCLVGSVARSAGLGGVGITDLVMGANEVPKTTRRAWVVLGASPIFCLP